MKTLTLYAKTNNLELVKIKYKAFGKYSIGFDLIKPETREIIASFEPVYYTNGDRWFLRNSHNNYIGKRYFKRLDKNALINIQPNETSYMLLSK